MSITPVFPTPGDVNTENGLLYVEATVGAGLLLSTYAKAYGVPGTPPEPDELLNDIGGGKYAAWIPYTPGQIKVHFRADFEDMSDAAAPPITAYGLTVEMPAP